MSTKTSKSKAITAERRRELRAGLQFHLDQLLTSSERPSVRIRRVALVLAMMDKLRGEPAKG